LATVTTIKLAVVSAMVGALLLVGAVLMGDSLVSAQTPTPEPTQPSQTEPAPEGERGDGVDCPKDAEDGAASAGSGVRFRGGSRGFVQ
jgi:hypothetical protein